MCQIKWKKLDTDLDQVREIIGIEDGFILTDFAALIRASPGFFLFIYLAWGTVLNEKKWPRNAEAEITLIHLV
jgi:hypothetical protein